MNAYEMKFRNLTLVPAEDFKDKRYTFVAPNADGKGVTPAAGAIAVGVIQEPNNVEEPAQVTVAGVSFIQIGAALVAGQEVEVGPAGKAIPLATGRSVGICMVGGSEGDLGSVLLK